MPRSYETVSDFGPIEYGCARGFICAVDGKSIETPAIAIESEQYALRGYACRYSEPLIHDGKIKVLQPGALDKSLRAGHPIRFQLDHDDNYVVGTTLDGLELLSDDYGLAFRFLIPGTAKGLHVRSLAQRKERTGVSIGYNAAKSVTRNVDGTPVDFIYEANLNEISLVRLGAIKRAYAVLEKADGLPPLSELSRNLTLQNDGAFVVVMRALQKLEDCVRQ
jgi:HK97 family phage prohead protease